MNKLSILIICFFAIFTLQFNEPQPAPDTATDNEDAIRKADIAWSAAAGQLETHLSYFLDDATVMASNEPIISGKEAIRTKLAELHGMPGFSVKWHPDKVEASGNLGYSIGKYTLTMNDDTGNPVTDYGKYLTIWKKQKDGSWKVSADMFNSDLPAH